ncbi:hypothetical protein [Cochlodiniinecator piscidefendens]|uniref:hypothetical protein n=1 Tax=Cochlodiniinecator piscidefendens TaxID=2715756 RepID=UPI00140DD725|nr:hypothetical protein [Cochlodiniinecator piscidefendens]
MSNNLTELNNHLFEQLNRMSSESLTPEQLEQEVKRANAIVSISDQVSKNADLQLKAAKVFAEHGAQVLPHLPLIGGKSE